ncbi:hypothetical protein GmHk_04G009537 [Glycine max]|nr:hypothetical protein GmHk_04G009537 [Glycine max]
MAKNPVKGNLDHGNEGRHGCWSASVASESMWTNPVARMTPAAKALAATKRLPSVRRCFRTSGMAIPAMPARRMEAMAKNLRSNAADSSRHSSNSAPPQLELVIDSRRFWKKDEEFSKSSVSRV